MIKYYIKGKSGNHIHVNNLTGPVEKNSSTIGPPVGVEPKPLRCWCNALTTELPR